jgi:hypothetical protein
MEFLPDKILLVKIALLRFYLVSGEYIEAATKVIAKIVRGVESAFKEKKYLFLEGYSTPFPEQAVNVYASASAAVDFRYNADTKQFSSGIGPKQCLPILSLEIVRDEVVFDLTDFIEGVSVISDNGFPSVSQLIQAWMIDSRVILTRECKFIARIVSNEGTTVELDVCDDSDIEDAIVPEEVPEVPEESLKIE